MSGRFFPEVREKLDELGVSECIEKPFYFEQIRDKIARVLNVEPSVDGTSSHQLLQPAATDGMLRAYANGSGNGNL